MRGRFCAVVGLDLCGNARSDKLSGRLGKDVIYKTEWVDVVKQQENLKGLLGAAGCAMLCLVKAIACEHQLHVAKNDGRAERLTRAEFERTGIMRDRVGRSVATGPGLSDSGSHLWGCAVCRMRTAPSRVLSGLGYACLSAQHR